MAARTKLAAASPVERIHELAGERDRLQELRALTLAAPRSFDEAAADIAGTVELLAARCEPHTQWLGLSPTGYADLLRQLDCDDGDHRSPSAASLLAWCLPDVLAAALKRDLERVYDSLPSPLSSAEKATEIQRLDREIARVDAEIASTWWQSVDSGLSLDPPPVDGATLVGLLA